jgi:hypothetical protein
LFSKPDQEQELRMVQAISRRIGQVPQDGHAAHPALAAPVLGAAGFSPLVKLLLAALLAGLLTLVAWTLQVVVFPRAPLPAATGVTNCDVPVRGAVATPKPKAPEKPGVDKSRPASR